MSADSAHAERTSARALRRALLWLDPEQVDLFRGIAETAELAVASVGDASATRGRAADLATTFDAAPVDDLRRALSTSDLDLVLLGAAVGTEYAPVLKECVDRGVRVVSLEPLPAGVLEVLAPAAEGGFGPGADNGMGLSLGPEPQDEPAPDPTTAAEWAVFVPLARHAAVVRNAVEVIQQLGTLRMVSVQTYSGTGQGSLGARIFDAIELITWLLGQPETIDAALVPATSIPASAAAPAGAPTLRGLEGDLTATLRYSGGAAGSIVASSRAGRWSRTITLVGEHGRVRIYDDGLEWINAQGAVVEASRDAHRIRGASQVEPSQLAAVRVISEQVLRLLDPARAASPPSNILSVLATAGAALLSARTGQGESPDVMLRMK